MTFGSPPPFRAGARRPGAGSVGRVLAVRVAATYLLLAVPGSDEVHGFLRHASWLEVFDRTAGFFDAHLRGG